MPVPNVVIISRATYGATPAATYAFFTKDYTPPVQNRSLEVDVVHNQNGKFKHVYDNGPGFKAWSPFKIACENKFATVVGVIAATQYSRLLTLWEYPGVLGMRTPDGTYSIHWAANPLERAFKVFPFYEGDVPEWEVTVQFEEAT